MAPARPFRLPVTRDLRLLIHFRLDFHHHGNSPCPPFAFGARPRPSVTDRPLGRSILAEVATICLHRCHQLRKCCSCSVLVDQDSLGPLSSDAYLVYVNTSHDSLHLTLHQATLPLTCFSRPRLRLVVNKMFWFTSRRWFFFSLFYASLRGDARVKPGSPSL